MINLQEVMDDVSEIDTIEVIQTLINKGVTPKQYKAAYQLTSTKVKNVVKKS